MCENCNKNSSGVFKATMIVIGLALIALVGFLAWEQYRENACLNDQPVGIATEVVPTVDEAVDLFINDVQSYNRYEKYIRLSPTILRAIFTKIGTQPTVKEIMNEYETNKSYYLSLQAAEAIGEIDMPGPDAKSIKKISTTVELDTTPPISKDLKRVSPAE